MARDTEQAVRREFSANLNRLLAENHMTQLELASRLGVGAATVNDWVKGRTTPRSNVLQRLTEVFCCRISDLLGPSPAPAAESAVLTVRAQRIGLLYQKANDRDRQLVDTVLAPYEKDLPAVPVENDAPRLIALPKAKVRHRRDLFDELTVFEEPGAAGLGNYLSETPPSHTEQYPAGLVPEGANYGVPISGDSMMPAYRNGSTAFIQALPAIRSGEVGLFLLNGEAYLKQLLIDRNSGSVRLHSLNPAYSDIEIREKDVLYTFGRVLGSYPS